VVPVLRTYPFIRIWHAGCSTGEEVYSMAIVLQEAGLYDRCRIYATDMNELVLKKAKAGIFPLKQMQEYTQLYHQAGGRKAFSEYYTAAYENAIFGASLKDNMVFAHHNLATDTSFNEFNVILCRNVLIYSFSQINEVCPMPYARFGLCPMTIPYEHLMLLRKAIFQFTPPRAGTQAFL
jgi:chemotaxis protein methyltransferase CheR